MKYHNIPTLFDNQASLINGKNIGTDSVRYIQDAGQKTAGNTYIDRNTNELYVCVTTTNSVNNDGNFSKFNLKEAFNKLDNLYKYEKIYDGNFTKYGLAIILAIYGNNLMTTLNITVFGVSEIQDPYLYQIPYSFAPLVSQRTIGFAELDVLVLTNGFIQLSCAQGQQIGSEPIYGRGEVGLTFLHR